MSDSLPPSAAPPVEETGAHHFIPVFFARTRRDGWTEARQRAFIAALARTGHVTQAARLVGMSAKSAYALYKRAGADSDFAIAWRNALWEGQDRAFDRAIQAARGVVHIRRKLPGGWIERRVDVRAGEGLPASLRLGIR